MDDMRNFPDPRNVEEALRRKRQIADEVTQLQAKMKDRAPADQSGQIIIDKRVRNDFRQTVKHNLESLYAEARFLKDWLRQNATHKPSEYDMLGRAYRLLSEIDEHGLLSPDGESLLEDIEMHVPHSYLFRERGAA
jgi:hypothetical protein